MDNDTRTTTGYTKGFTSYAQIPKWVLRNPELSHGAVRLYGAIMSYADNATRFAFPSRETLAANMGVSVRSIGNYIAELEEREIVEVDRRRNKRTGNFYANSYTLVFEEPAQDSPEEEYFPRREEADFPITKPTDLPKPTSPTPPSPAMEKPLTPSPNGKDTHKSGKPLHKQLNISEGEADTLRDLTVAFYETGLDIDSRECEELEDTFEALTGFYIGDAVANKKYRNSLGARILEYPTSPRYAVSRWLGTLRNYMAEQERGFAA